MRKFSRRSKEISLPIIQIHINHKIACLIDTGSTTSVMNPNIAQNFNTETLIEPKFFTTLNGVNKVIKIVKTPIPCEFLTFGTISWKIIELKNRKFYAVIGQNVLRSLNAKINFESNFIEIKNNRICFMDSNYSFCINNIYSLEPIEDTIFDNLSLDHINSE